MLGDNDKGKKNFWTDDIPILREILQELKKGNIPDRLKENINFQDGFGNTILHIAVTNNNTEAVKTLINNGADFSITNKAGNRPLDIAVRHKNNHLIQEAASHRVVDDGNLSTKTFFDQVLESGDADLIQSFIQGGVSTDMSNREGHAPHLDADRGHFDAGGKNKKGERTFLRWFSWASGYDGKMSLLDRTGLGWLIKKALDSLVPESLTEYLKKTPKTYGEIMISALLAPVVFAATLPSLAWHVADRCVAAVATPFLWLGERLKNLILDLFRSVPHPLSGDASSDHGGVASDREPPTQPQSSFGSDDEPTVEQPRGGGPEDEAAAGRANPNPNMPW